MKYTDGTLALELNNLIKKISNIEKSTKSDQKISNMNNKQTYTIFREIILENLEKSQKTKTSHKTPTFCYASRVRLHR